MTTSRWFQQRLSHSCMVQRDSGTSQSLSGEIGTSWADSGTRRPCRYVERRETFANESGGAITLKTRLLLMNGTSDVITEDRIVDIWDNTDTLIDAGPFTVEDLAVRRRTDGTVHHLSLRIERVEAT